MAEIPRRAKKEIEKEPSTQARTSLRTERNRRVAESDWIMPPDAPLLAGTPRERCRADRQTISAFMTN